MRICCIVNSKSISKQSFLTKIKEPIETGLAQAIDTKFTLHKTHAIQLTGEAIEKGYDLIIGVGGDGTLNEMVNGYIKCPIEKKPVCTLLPLGTGNDFSRTMKINNDVNLLLERINAFNPQPLDVCQINLTSGEKKYFINSSSVGFSATVVRNVNYFSLKLLGSIAYQIGSLITFLKYRKKQGEIESGEFIWEGKYFMMAFSKGEFMGGGMKLARETGLQNGKISVTIIGDINLFNFVKNLTRVSLGKTIKHQEGSYFNAKSLKFKNRMPYEFEIDGEYIKGSPESITCIPGKFLFL